MKISLNRKVVWTSTFALIIFILKNYFDIEIPKADELIELILLVATALGLWSNPNIINNKEEP